ncbi:DNA ligase 1-like [Cloeon dipterum]|uniref:DNA ligase 1-like n=1 Tax=Cloeon dipterum TaxID=197152 RepID=UPI00321FC5B7
MCPSSSDVAGPQLALHTEENSAISAAPEDMEHEPERHDEAQLQPLQNEPLLQGPLPHQPIQDRVEEIMCPSSSDVAEPAEEASVSAESEDMEHEPERHDISSPDGSSNQNNKTASKEQADDVPPSVTDENKCLFPRKLNIFREKLEENRDPRMDAKIPRPLKSRIDDLKQIVRKHSFDSEKEIEEIEKSKQTRIYQIERDYKMAISRVKANGILERQREFEKNLGVAEAALEKKKKEIEVRRKDGDKAKEDLAHLMGVKEGIDGEMKKLDEKLSGIRKEMAEKEETIKQINLLSSSREEQDVNLNKTGVLDCEKSYKEKIEEPGRERTTNMDRLNIEFDKIIKYIRHQQQKDLERVQLKLKDLENELASSSKKSSSSSESESDSNVDIFAENDEPKNKSSSSSESESDSNVDIFAENDEPKNKRPKVTGKLSMHTARGNEPQEKKNKKEIPDV